MSVARGNRQRDEQILRGMNPTAEQPLAQMDREASRRSLTWLGAGENNKSSVNSSMVEVDKDSLLFQKKRQGIC